MRHHKIATMLSEYLDGRLSSNDIKIVKQHLEKCGQCRNLYDSFMMLHKRSENDAPFAVRPYFTQRVMNGYHLRRRDAVRELFGRLPRPLVAAGLLLSFVLLLLFAPPRSAPPSEIYESEFAILFDANTKADNMSDDEALAIAINAETVLATGE